MSVSKRSTKNTWITNTKQNVINGFSVEVLEEKKELIKMAKNPCSDQKMNCIIENMYIRSGLYLKYPN